MVQAKKKKTLIAIVLQLYMGIGSQTYYHGYLGQNAIQTNNSG